MRTSTGQFDCLPSYSKWESCSACIDVGQSIRVIIVAFAFILSHIPAYGQQSTVTGTITDDTGEGIPGVNVIVKGTTDGTSTDLNGIYAIKLPQAGAAILVISFIGYNQEEIVVGQRTVVDLQLTPNITELDEIVVTGYAAISKKDISSSISVVDVKDMQKYAASNFAEQLVGKVPGVQVTTTSDPGSSQSIRIRGIGSVNNNEPLYVIDGVPVQNEANMNFLNPNDIESMQVLKDAASSSIYGARAANGVVVITTRNGRGKPKLNVDFYSGVQVVGKTPEMANPTETLEIEKGLASGAGQPLTNSLYVKDNEGNWTLPDYYVYQKGYKEGDPAVDPSKYVLNTAPTGDYSNNYPITKANKDGTDWFKEMFRPAPITSLQLSASGGSERGNYYLSVNYFDHQGIMIRNFYKRFQTRVNSTYNVSKNIRVGENVNVSYQTNKGAMGSGSGINFSNAPGVGSIYSENQLKPVYDIKGYWASNNVVASQNRVADGTRGNTWRTTGNIFGEVDFLKSFFFKTSYGLDVYSGPQENYGYSCPECGPASFANSLKISWFNNSSWVWSNTISFNKDIGNHTISILAGAEARRTFSEGSSGEGRNLVYGDDPNYRILDNVDPKTYGMSSFKTENKMSSIFANANYNYNNKYLVTATLRRDGSSKFLNNKYGLFPAASVGWRISNEPFLASATYLTSLKLRASYGATGSNEVLGGDYPGFTTYTTTKFSSSYDINGTGNTIVPGFAKWSVGNPDLKWETSILADIGADITLWKKLDVSLDWFQRKTKDMIYPVELPLQSGGFYQNQNIGSMINSGLEALITFRNALANSLQYSVSVSATHYTNKVLTLDANSNSFVNAGFVSGMGFITRTQAGYPISQFRGYITDGLWQSQQQINDVLFTSIGEAKPGRMKFLDLNDDGQIDESDKTFIGSPIPKLLLGVNLTLAYKNFDLTAYIAGAYGRKVFDVNYYFTDFSGPFRGNPSKQMLYEAGKTLPVLDNRDGYSSQPSTYYVSDASYTRLRNVVLGYTFSRTLSAKAGIQKARIYLQGQNLFTLTSYKGLDPEGSIAFVANGNQPQRDYVTGVDNLDFGRYPPAKQIIVGLNIEF